MTSPAARIPAAPTPHLRAAGAVLFGDFGAPVLPATMTEALTDHRHLWSDSVRPVSRAGKDLPDLALEDLFLGTCGSKRLEPIDLHATLDRAFETLVQADRESSLFGDEALAAPFCAPDSVFASRVLMGHVPMSTRLRSAWGELLPGQESEVADTLEFSRADLAAVADGWSAVAEWSMLLEHFFFDPRAVALLDAVRHAPDLESVADLMTLDLIRADGHRLDLSWADLLRRRKGWGVPSATLDEVGRAVGLTRERARQIEVRLFGRCSLRAWTLPNVLATSMHLALDAGIPDNRLGAALQEAGLAHESAWKRESIAGLVEAMGHPSVAGAVRAAAARSAREAAQSRAEDNAVVNRIRQARSHLGFLRLSAVFDSAGEEIPAAHVLALVQRTYPRTAACDGWVLAGGDRPTGAENAALAQLAVTQPLPGKVLLDGLDRSARKRQGPALPPGEIALELLARIGCIAVEKGMALPLVPAPLPEPDSNDRWLHDLLNEQPARAMHADEVMRLARAQGRNESSIGVHLTYSAILRRDDGLVSLVGSTIDSTQRSVLKRAAHARKVDSAYSVEWTDEGPVLTLTLGTSYLTAYVVSIRQDVLSAVNIAGLGTACCPDYRSDSKLGISNVGTVYGWTSLFRHWTSEHGVVEGEQVRILLGDSVVSTLEPWATAR